MLSQNYKCIYFQLPDCSSKPSVLCHACFCLRFSFQHALPQKVLPTSNPSSSTYQETTNTAKEWAFQALLVEHQSAFKYLIWLTWTHFHFQQAAHDLRELYTIHPPLPIAQSYTPPLLPCKTAIMSAVSPLHPQAVFSPSSYSVTTLKYNTCRTHDGANYVKMHFWLTQFTRLCEFQCTSCLVLVYHTA